MRDTPQEHGQRSIREYEAQMATLTKLIEWCGPGCTLTESRNCLADSVASLQGWIKSTNRGVALQPPLGSFAVLVNDRLDSTWRSSEDAIRAARTLARTQGIVVLVSATISKNGRVQQWIVYADGSVVTESVHESHLR